MALTDLQLNGHILVRASEVSPLPVHSDSYSYKT